MADPKIALTTNTAYLPHTMVAMLSVLENAKRPVSVHILGDEFSAAARKVVEEGCRRGGAADLVFHDLEEILPRRRLLGNWSRVILGRLWIPELIDGRVLYLDGDTYTFGDISPLFEMDMGGDLLGVVRDFGRFQNFKGANQEALENTASCEEIMRPFPRHDYFNSGVLLFDCDGIRKNDDVRSQIARVEKLENYLLPDQDHLNIVFKNRTLFLHPSWNSFYGMTGHTVRLSRKVMPPETVHDAKPPKIIHYVFGPKPWESFEPKWLTKTSFMFRRFPRYAEYRRNARRLLAPCRAAVDEAVSASYLTPLDGAKCKEGGGGAERHSDRPVLRHGLPQACVDRDGVGDRMRFRTRVRASSRRRPDQRRRGKAEGGLPRTGGRPPASPRRDGHAGRSAVEWKFWGDHGQDASSAIG